MRHLLPILRALHDAGVAFVVVGGVAVVLQGHPRLTVDLDLVLDLSTANVRTAVETLTALGLRPRLPVPASELADPQIRRAWVEERNLTAFSLHDPNDPRTEVDLFAFEPVPWAELVADAVVREIDGVSVHVASRAHLIAMKTGTGRPQDLADIAALEALEALDG